MKKFYHLLGAALLFGKIFGTETECETCGKIEIAPTYVHVDVLNSGKTTEQLDMGGARLEGAYIIKKGWGFCLKPMVLYVGQNNSSLFIAGLGLGHVTPITSKFYLTPSIGCTYGDLRTTISMHEARQFHLKEKFRSISPYVCLEGTYRFTKTFRLSAQIQYAWSRTHTTISKLLSQKSHSEGPVYGVMIEQDINQQWSVNLGGSYNSSLSHEKHGIRGYGIKMGLVRWF